MDVSQNTPSSHTDPHVLAIVAAGLFVLAALAEIKFGISGIRYSFVRRDQKPVAFWFGVSMCLAFAVITLVVGFTL